MDVLTYKFDEHRTDQERAEDLIRSIYVLAKFPPPELGPESVIREIRIRAEKMVMEFGARSKVQP